MDGGIARYTHDTLEHWIAGIDGVWGSVRSPLVGLAGCVRRFVTLPDWDVSIVTEPSVCYLEVWVVIAHCVARIQ